MCGWHGGESVHKSARPSTMAGLMCSTSLLITLSSGQFALYTWLGMGDIYVARERMRQDVGEAEEWREEEQRYGVGWSLCCEVGASMGRCPRGTCGCSWVVRGCSMGENRTSA